MANQMEVSEIEVDPKEIEGELQNLKTAIREGFISKRRGLTKDLMAVYGHLRHGGKIIDLADTWFKTGLRKDGLPKLAIVRYDGRFCYLYRKKNGGAIFSHERKRRWHIHANQKSGDVVAPPDTFVWTEDFVAESDCHKSAAPIVPPRIAVEVGARLVPEKYHILYEAESWEKSSPIAPRDPILGRMLTPRIFGVLATWDLTTLERAILKGRLK